MKTQEIKRSDLKIIYENVCQSWQKRISDILLWNINPVIDFPEELIYQGYEEADTAQKKLIDKYFTIIQPKDLFTVKSFSELCEITCIKELFIKDFKIFGLLAEKMLALWQIKIIEQVYNNGWIPDFSNKSQLKYYPYFVNGNGLWRCDGSDGYYCHFAGLVGLYKNKKTSDFVGKTFIEIYLKVI